MNLRRFQVAEWNFLHLKKIKVYHLTDRQRSDSISGQGFSLEFLERQLHEHGVSYKGRPFTTRNTADLYLNFDRFFPSKRTVRDENPKVWKPAVLVTQFRCCQDKTVRRESTNRGESPCPTNCRLDNRWGSCPGWMGRVTCESDNRHCAQQSCNDAP